MNSILPGTIEEQGLETFKVGTLEASPAAPWLALEAVRLTLFWLDGAGGLPSPHRLRAQELNVINVAAGLSGRPNKPLGSKPQVAFRTF
jgi:hypothetical protein